VLGLDQNSGEGEASLLEVGAHLVGNAIDSGMVVMNAPVGGIGASMCDQIVQNFLLQLGPNGAGKQENALDLGFGVEELIAGPAGDAAAQPAEEVFCLGKVCGLFQWLCFHEELGIRKETGKAAGHGVGCEH